MNANTDEVNVNGEQDCEDYARRASLAEVDSIANALSGGIFGAISYGYWLGVCETHGDGTLLDPVFL